MSYTPNHPHMYMGPIYTAEMDDDARRKVQFLQDQHKIRVHYAQGKREAEKDGLSSRFDRLNLTPVKAVDDACFRAAAASYERQPSYPPQPTHHRQPTQPARSSRPRQPSHSSHDYYAPAPQYEEDDHVTLVDGDRQPRQMYSDNRRVLHEELTHDDSISSVGRRRTSLREGLSGRGSAGFEAVDERSDVVGPSDEPPRHSRKPTRRHSQTRRAYNMEREHERQYEGQYRPGPGQYGYVDPRAPVIPPAAPMPPPAAGYDYNCKYEQQIANCAPY